MSKENMDEEDISEVYDLGQNLLKCECGHNLFKCMCGETNEDGEEYTYVCADCGKGYLNVSDLLFANEGRLREVWERDLP